MIELNEQQCKELSFPEPRAIDPATREEYVLLRATVYERVKGLLSDDVDPEAMYARLAELDPDDWEDPSVYGLNLKS